MADTIAAAARPEIFPGDTPHIREGPKKEDINARVNAMKKYRLEFEKRWKSIRDYQLPFLGEFWDTEDKTNEARRRDLAISNGTPWLAAQAFAAGIMSGLTPPSRQWFKFGFSDLESADDIEAGNVLDQRQQIVEYVLHKSNFYNAIHAAYMELPFGQAPLGIFMSPDSYVRFQTYPVGTYYLGTNAAGRVNTFCRRYRMTAAQLLEQFGKDALPTNVKSALANAGSRHENPFEVWWLVIPNDKRIPGDYGNTNMPYLSLYWVDGQSVEENGGFLYVGGFEEFPVPTGRYNVSGLCPYGKGPGWYAEGDAKALQVMKKDLLTAVELMVKPPMKAPSNVYSKGINLIPGGVTPVDETMGSNTVQPLFQVPTNPEWLAQEIIRTEDAIKRAYSADLFLMLDSIDTPQMTAREVMERQQEKLQQLGPVVERLQDEFLSPIIERVYNILDRGGVFPPLSPEMAERIAERDVKIEYISPLAQAQKMSGLVNIEQAVAFTVQMAQAWPEALKAVDPFGTIKDYYEMLGAPARMQRSMEDIQQMIRQEQEAMAQQQEEARQMAAAQAAAPMAQAAKNMTEAANDGNPALRNLLGIG